MNIFQIDNRTIFRLVALFCGGLLLSAFFLQYFVSQVPCPLCILQRFFYFFIGLVALIASFGWPRKRSVYFSGILMMFLSLIGGAIAGRQVWLQQYSIVTDATKCVVPFGSFFDSVMLALGGIGSCVSRDFTIFGLSIADWSLLCFFFLFCVSVFITVRFAWTRYRVTREND
ncbi:MAG: disulfide bond formation protein B [Candidatus Moranbacteria bacterium]|nr:disulfide bond formation protein B [Candidatus Moranbacteria bacterium]